ncbi:MAG TPA: hypothetical protein PL048_17500 [Leptospiraceae bacterium]|nr:hypothetical protein [Leptospiraceae bacterium]HMY69469.1 hypothetical protein [Leptospiraceae bacterium]HMZ60574.1 hypothetical protein [Leptospiraceae bacterium]HNF12171.1 hypothetical protein [Leptospiraceae bacterium]HNF23364.1 hypothetical protein [Leptospiraceae bacterium]
MIQNNAFSSEETASASMELSEQAGGIDRMVKRFKISELPVHIIKTERNESRNTVLHRSESGRVLLKKKTPSEVISL